MTTEQKLDVEQLRQQRYRLLADMREIAEQDVVNIALDPEWPKRIARAAIKEVEESK